MRRSNRAITRPPPNIRLQLARRQLLRDLSERHDFRNRVTEDGSGNLLRNQPAGRSRVMYDPSAMRRMPPDQNQAIFALRRQQLMVMWNDNHRMEEWDIIYDKMSENGNKLKLNQKGHYRSNEARYRRSGSSRWCRNRTPYPSSGENTEPEFGFARPAREIPREREDTPFEDGNGPNEEQRMPKKESSKPRLRYRRAFGSPSPLRMYCTLASDIDAILEEERLLEEERQLRYQKYAEEIERVGEEDRKQRAWHLKVQQRLKEEALDIQRQEQRFKDKQVSQNREGAGLERTAGTVHTSPYMTFPTAAELQEAIPVSGTNVLRLREHFHHRIGSELIRFKRLVEASTVVDRKTGAVQNKLTEVAAETPPKVAKRDLETSTNRGFGYPDPVELSDDLEEKHVYESGEDRHSRSYMAVKQLHASSVDSKHEVPAEIGTSNVSGQNDTDGADDEADEEVNDADDDADSSRTAITAQRNTEQLHGRDLGGLSSLGRKRTAEEVNTNNKKSRQSSNEDGNRNGDEANNEAATTLH